MMAEPTLGVGEETTAVELTAAELLLLRQRLAEEFQTGSSVTSLGVVDSVLDQKLYQAQLRLPLPPHEPPPPVGDWPASIVQAMADAPVHAADCALVTTHHLTCTCGASNRAWQAANRAAEADPRLDHIPATQTIRGGVRYGEDAAELVLGAAAGAISGPRTNDDGTRTLTFVPDNAPNKTARLAGTEVFYALCWAEPPGQHVACDRMHGHHGRHSWEPLEVPGAPR